VPKSRFSCLVTGGAGFIGSHLVEALVTLGYPVRVVDNLSTGDEANLAPVSEAIDFIVGDICDPRSPRARCKASKWFSTWRHSRVCPDR
jgi:nucleoside-diphosphate-sugar epimerase